MNNRKKGNIYEEVAIKYLQKLNYYIVDRNFYYRGGEIDIIAMKYNRLKFIEVKYRSSDKYGSAINSLTKSKYLRIIRGIQIYIEQHNMYNYEIDIEAVIIDCNKIEVISYD